jgi:hypothetical protein
MVSVTVGDKTTVGAVVSGVAVVAAAVMMGGCVGSDTGEAVDVAVGKAAAVLVAMAAAVWVASSAGDGVRVGGTNSSTGTVHPNVLTCTQPFSCLVDWAYTHCASSLRKVTLNTSRFDKLVTTSALSLGVVRMAMRVVLLTKHSAKNGGGAVAVGVGKPARRVASMRCEMRSAASGFMRHAEANTAKTHIAASAKRTFI